MMDALLDDAELRRMAWRLRPEGDLREAIARVAWCVLSEPGDGVAGALVAELGPAEALRVAVGTDVALTGLEGGSARAQQALREARRRWMPRADVRAVRDALRGAVEVTAALVLPGEPEWPEGLDDLGEHAPHLLWVRGDPTHLAAATRVSIVGARAATAYGESIAGEFAGDLARTGTLVVSGGAYGIDGAAHRAALGTGGTTVAFLAGGVDRAYPAGHQQLFERIMTSGAVVSELPCGSAPTKWRFLSRNRLIAALGIATVVVEAGWRSGSLNTAGHAAALGRPLGAVPGPVTSAASAGCHRLLREYDARCVTTSAEVRELLGGPTPSAVPATADDPDQIRLLDAISTRTPRHAHDLARRSGLSPERVTALLGLLSLEGTVVGTEDGWRRTAS